MRVAPTRVRTSTTRASMSGCPSARATETRWWPSRTKYTSPTRYRSTGGSGRRRASARRCAPSACGRARSSGGTRDRTRRAGRPCRGCGRARRRAGRGRPRRCARARRPPRRTAGSRRRRPGSAPRAPAAGPAPERRRARRKSSVASADGRPVGSEGTTRSVTTPRRPSTRGCDRLVPSPQTTGDLPSSPHVQICASPERGRRGAARRATDTQTVAAASGNLFHAAIDATYAEGHNVATISMYLLTDNEVGQVGCTFVGTVRPRPRPDHQRQRARLSGGPAAVRTTPEKRLGHAEGGAQKDGRLGPVVARARVVGARCARVGRGRHARVLTHDDAVAAAAPALVGRAQSEVHPHVGGQLAVVLGRVERALGPQPWVLGGVSVASNVVCGPPKPAGTVDDGTSAVTM